MSFSKFSIKKLDVNLNSIMGGQTDGTTASKGSTTMSAGSDSDPRGNDVDSGKVAVISTLDPDGQ